MGEWKRLNDYPEFNEKTVVVTGGSGGIGRAAAIGFAKRGARVAIADIKVEEGHETVKMIEDAGGEAFFSESDISKSNQVAAFVEKVVGTYGRLDYAINNAGIDGAIGPITDYPEDAWNEIIGTNMTGVWLCMKYEIPHMLKQGKGAIVNTASMASYKALANISGYNASKAGVLAVTQTAAMELATEGIRVNAVCPGAADTPMTVNQAKTMGVPLNEWRKNAAQFAPMKRMAQAHEPADAAIWLCSEGASFITGTGLVVDGGSLAGWPFG